MAGERAQGVRGQTEVGDAGLHVDPEVQGRAAASRRAGGECNRGSGGVVTWWGKLHVWHGCGQSERPSVAQSAGNKYGRLQGQKAHDDDHEDVSKKLS